MKKTFIILTILIAALVLSVGTLAYNDIADTDVSEAVSVLDALGVINGYSDGGYHPNATLTRGELSKLITVLLGEEDKLSTYSQKTLFSDVTSEHWAASYINLVYSKGLLKGYGDGNFGPDDRVTYAQLLTVMLRILDYSDSEIGAVYPDDYISLANRLELSKGVELGADENISRGDTAILLVNLIASNNKSGVKFYKKLVDSSLENAVILSVNSLSDTGKQNCAKLYVDGNVVWYPKSAEIPETLIGVSGTVLIDKNEKILAFLPDTDSFLAVSGILLVNSQQSSNGVLPYETVMYVNGNELSYPRVSAISQSDVGSYGTLLLDANGYATAFISDESDVYTIVKNAVLVNNDTVSDTGRKNYSLFLVNGKATYYERSENVSFLYEDIGKSGTALLDADGCITDFLPDGKDSYEIEYGTVIDVDKNEAELMINEVTVWYDSHVSMTESYIGASGTFVINEYGEISAFLSDGEQGRVYKNVILLANDTVNPDGLIAAKFLVNNNVEYYELQYTVPDKSDVLNKGTLVLDSEDVVLAFYSEDEEYTSHKGILIKNGSSTADFYIDGEIASMKLSVSIPSSEIGQYGTLLLDSRGRVIAFYHGEGEEKYTVTSEGILVSANTVAADGNTRTVKFFVNGNLSTYKASYRMGDSEELMKGFLLVDANNEAVRLIPTVTNCRQENVVSADENLLSGGTMDYKMLSNIPVISENQQISWKNAHGNLEGEDIIIYFDFLGEIEMIYVY